MWSACASGRSSRVSDGVVAAYGDVVISRISALAQLMRAQGTRVGLGEVLTAQQALTAVDSSSRDDARLALRSVLCSSHRDIGRFEEAFRAVFGDERMHFGQDPYEPLGKIERPMPPRAAVAGDAFGTSEDQDPMAVPAAYSDVELLGHKDFSQYTDAEMAIARVLIARLAQRGPTRLSRRTRPARRRSHTPDLRRVVRASLRTGGEPIQRHWRAPSTRPRP